MRALFWPYILDVFGLFGVTFSNIAANSRKLSIFPVVVHISTKKGFYESELKTIVLTIFLNLISSHKLVTETRKVQNN